MRSPGSPRKRRPPLLIRLLRFGQRCFTGLVLLLLLILSFRQIESFLQKPQAVLVLGGPGEREKFAATFAQEHPDLPIWISSGAPQEYAEWVFTEAGITPSRLHLDYQAADTVTNFTTLVDQFKAQGITSIYLITSDYHMRRASVIGEIVLGSRGIDFKTVSVPSQRSPEPLEKVLRDGARAILWVTTGSTGENLARFVIRH
ncbi:MAG: YdcF family protein [Leptolyngbyaceae cyanobacterium CRU_2_3]|nr:YdcF family protein [Leptolyngbyaceae cyanobacterium CRU_2_3]